MGFSLCINSHKRKTAIFAKAYASFVGSNSPVRIRSSVNGFCPFFGYIQEEARFKNFLIPSSLATLIKLKPI